MRAWMTAAIMAPALLAAGPPPAREAPERCGIPQAWSTVAARKTRYILLGEVHGTRESPAFLAATACGLARRGERLLVAVEHDAMGNGALQAAWRLPHDQFAAALVRTGWAGRRDGVASEAMFAMLVRLHALSSKGARIDVVAFNGTRDAEQRERFKGLPGQGPHEAAQAENIRTAAEAKRYDHVLVLVGGLHARKEPVERGGFTFEPMAMRLGPPASITSLNMAFGKGTMWNCLLKPIVVLKPGQPIGGDAMDCGSHPTSASAKLDRAPFVGLGRLEGSDAEGNYDGYYWVGPVTGSPPAVPGP
jgi:hypothetical protein